MIALLPVFCAVVLAHHEPRLFTIHNGLTFDSAGNLYIADTFNQVGTLAGVALDGAGNLYFTDRTNNVVWEVAADTGVATVVAGNGTAGYTGDGGTATDATLYDPLSVAVDAAGNLYIADADNLVIRKVTAATGVIATIAGTGKGGSAGDGGPAIDAEFEFPTGVALDSAGNLYIADSGSHRVRVVAASTGIITTVAGDGSNTLWLRRAA